MEMDVTEEWNFETKFDFIHVRMLGDIQDKAKLLQSIYDNLNPGGWIEITEWIVLLQSPNHSIESTAFYRWNLLLRQGMSSQKRHQYHLLMLRQVYASWGAPCSMLLNIGPTYGGLVLSGS